MVPVKTSCSLIGVALQQEAGDLNQTERADLQLANHTGLLEEMESMLDSIRAVTLTNHTAAHQHR